jgi:hypothetical protein
VIESHDPTSLASPIFRKPVCLIFGAILVDSATTAVVDWRTPTDKEARWVALGRQLAEIAALIAAPYG